MLTVPTALLWALLAWLIASDNRLPWLAPAAQPSSKTATGQKKGQVRRRPDSLTAYSRAAAYAAIAALFWSWSPTPDEDDLGAAHQAQPSFTVDSTQFGLAGQDMTIDSFVAPEISDEDRFEQAIRNETLGFEKIIVVNLPERTDKRDGMSLAAALTNIKLTWWSAIRGTSVPDKALPLGVDRNGWRDGGIGSWRSQMNAIRTMVEDNTASALILEDDADWDVRIKDQLGFIARGTRLLLDRAHREEAFASKLNAQALAADAADSPYGAGWDVLWLGHCGETFPERIPGHQQIFDASSARYTYYAMEEDETLPAEAESWIEGELLRHKGTRWVHFSGGPTCSQAYALSRSGARKVLLALSVGGTLVEQLDNAISHLCRDHTPWDGPGDDHGPPGYPGANMRCLSVNPAVFQQHKPRGRKAAESDIETVADGEDVREVGESPNLVWSARLNVQNLMNGWPMKEQNMGGADKGAVPEEAAAAGDEQAADSDEKEL